MEGMTPEVIVEALRRAGATFEDEQALTPNRITKQDMMDLGLSGGANSAKMRQQIIQKLNFPKHMSANALLDALNLLYTADELKCIVETLECNNG